MLKSDFKERLERGEKLFGTFVKLNAPPIVEIMGLKGFDFIIIDMEHSAYSYSEVEKMIQAADINQLPVIIRIPNHTEDQILHALDAGAYGVQIPNITKIEQVQSVIDGAKYYPEGHRGLSFAQRAAGYGLFGGDAYINASNRNSIISVHIENIQMAQQVEALCAMPAVDVLFIGPADLSQSMGKPGQTEDMEVVAVIEKIFETALRYGKKVGIYAGSQGAIEKYSRLGATYFAYKSDVLLMAEGILAAEGVFKSIQ